MNTFRMCFFQNKELKWRRQLLLYSVASYQCLAADCPQDLSCADNKGNTIWPLDTRCTCTCWRLMLKPWTVCLADFWLATRAWSLWWQQSVVSKVQTVRNAAVFLRVVFCTSGHVIRKKPNLFLRKHSKKQRKFLLSLLWFLRMSIALKLLCCRSCQKGSFW